MTGNLKSTDREKCHRPPSSPISTLLQSSWIPLQLFQRFLLTAFNNPTKPSVLSTHNSCWMLDNSVCPWFFLVSAAGTTQISCLNGNWFSIASCWWDVAQRLSGTDKKNGVQKLLPKIWCFCLWRTFCGRIWLAPSPHHFQRSHHPLLRLVWLRWQLHLPPYDSRIGDQLSRLSSEQAGQLFR